MLKLKFLKACTKPDSTDEYESAVNDDEVVDENDTEISSSDQNDISEGSNINIKSVKLSITTPKQNVNNISNTSEKKRKRSRLTNY